jgi:hypothetical protein
MTPHSGATRSRPAEKTDSEFTYQIIVSELTTVTSLYWQQRINGNNRNQFIRHIAEWHQCIAHRVVNRQRETQPEKFRPEKA